MAFLLTLEVQIYSLQCKAVVLCDHGKAAQALRWQASAEHFMRIIECLLTFQVQQIRRNDGGTGYKIGCGAADSRGNTIKGVGQRALEAIMVSLLPL